MCASDAKVDRSPALAREVAGCGFVNVYLEASAERGPRYKESEILRCWRCLEVGQTLNLSSSKPVGTRCAESRVDLPPQKRLRALGEE
jgi:hypothetical protein